MTERMRRVNEAVREVLSEAIPTLKDPRIGFVTVTGVQTTTDLKQATVWVSVLGSEEAREATLTALAGAAGVLQAALNHELHMRRTPQLAFAYDPSVERGVRMTRLIDELAPQDEAGDDGS
jgi:ribosome-binding factor A